MVSEEDASRLIIYGITPADAGAYSISVCNVFGQASDVISVNIVGTRPTPPCTVTKYLRISADILRRVFHTF